MLSLDVIELTGDPAAMGRRHGELLRERIGAFMHDRLRAGRLFLRERRADPERLVATAAAALDTLRTWHPDGWNEHQAVAAGAGVDAAELYAAGNLTDIRDAAAFRPHADAEGCTTALVPAARSRSGQVIAAQTWDLNPPDLDFVVAVHRRPTGAPATWAITCAGCANLVGLNAAGLAVGTTNIKVHGVRPGGVGYLSVLHRLLTCRDRAEAAAVLQAAPRAAAHTYWLADPGGVEDWECTAASAWRRPGDGPLCRTNHCLDPINAAAEDEPPTSSSRARLARATAALAAGPIGVDDLRRLFADRSGGNDAINRYPEDGTGTATNACVICEPATRTIHACRGPADRGAWVSARL
jgi:isopenicillin-N N-acyltransferase-like protein